MTCPYHGGEFDIRTGQLFWSSRTLRVRKIPVRVKSGESILVDQVDDSGRRLAPYVA